MLPILGWVGGAVVAAVGAALLSDDSDDSSSSANRDNAIEKQKEKEAKEHNRKIYQEIISYKKEEILKIEKQYSIKLNQTSVLPDDPIVSTILSSMVADDKLGMINSSSMITFDGLDRSSIELENKRIEYDIKKLQEFKNGLK